MINDVIRYYQYSHRKLSRSHMSIKGQTTIPTSRVLDYLMGHPPLVGHPKLAVNTTNTTTFTQVIEAIQSCFFVPK